MPIELSDISRWSAHRSFETCMMVTLGEGFQADAADVEREERRERERGRGYSERD